MPTVGYLENLGRTRPNAVCVGLIAITTDHLDFGMGLKPLLERTGFAVGQEVDHPPPLEVDQDRPVTVTFLFGPIVDPEHPHPPGAQARSAPDAPQQGVGADPARCAWRLRICVARRRGGWR